MAFPRHPNGLGAAAVSSPTPAAREAKGLSQRALAERVGIPQGHISRIENANVDLQASSLIQIARALDLELMLIPRNALPAIEALRRRRPIDEPPAASRNRIRLNSLRGQIVRLAGRFPQAGVLKHLMQTTLELRELPLELPTEQSHQFLLTIEEIRRVMRELSSQPVSAPPNPALIKEAETLQRELRSIRNAIVHGQAASFVTPTPAYTLDDNEPGNG
jgi:transcriptional regulator with XRE-family HTH domain